MATLNLPERRSDTLVCTPTYNEGGSIGALLDGLLASPRPFDIVIVDDGSTDGTENEILARARTHPQIHLIRRKGKLGIGSAHQLGWLHARRLGYARIVTLDADLSHDPADVPRLLDALDAGADVAIGSRFIAGGRLDYSGWRLAVSRTANIAARSLLAMPTYEQTTSLRAARLDKVPQGLVESMLRDGYAFFLELHGAVCARWPEDRRTANPLPRPQQRAIKTAAIRDRALRRQPVAAGSDPLEPAADSAVAGRSMHLRELRPALPDPHRRWRNPLPRVSGGAVGYVSEKPC